MMQARERVLTAFHRLPGLPDRTPFEISWGSFTPSLMEVYRRETGSSVGPEEYFDFDTRSVDLSPTRKTTDFRPLIAERVLPTATFDEWGCGFVPGSFEHFIEYKYHPLAAAQTVREVENFPWPDVTADYRYQGLAARVAEFQRAGYAVTGELCLTIFERAWQMRGMEGLMMDFLANPGMAHAVCQRLADFRVEQARRFARDGVDILRLGDDVCMQQGLMMSLDVYRTFFKERIRTIVTAAKEVKPDVLVFMHCDGCVEEVIQEYIDIGIDILNPIQPECNSLARIAARFGGRIAFWGGIGTQSTMPFGTPAQVHAKVREVKQVLGRQGGLLIAPSHVLEPDVPWQNVLAFVEAIQNARYD